MTLIDIKNALLTHFVSYSIFDVKEDLRRIKTDPDDVEFNSHLSDICRIALLDLAKLGIVAQISDTAFVLVQSINQLSQTVIVDPFTALMLADLVNGWTEESGEMKETGYVVNKLAITSRDINALCQIAATMLSSDDEPTGGSEQEDGEEDV